MKRSLAVLLAAQLGFLGSWGCATVTTDVSRRHGEGAVAASGSVRVSVFERREEVAGGIPTAVPVSSRLSRLEGKTLALVHESSESAWTLSDLPPGKYVFTVSRWIDAQGKVHGDLAEEGFRLAPGESVTIKAVLRDRRRNGAVTAAAVGGGALVVYLVYSFFRSLGNIALSGR